VYNQMKEDPEGRFPANFEDSWRLFFDGKEKALAYLKATCKPDKDYLILLDRETGAEKDYLVTYLVLGMFVKNLRSDLIPTFNDVFLQENEKSLKQLRDITKRHKELIRRFEKLKSKSQKRHEQDIATIMELQVTIKELEDTIGKRDSTIAMLLGLNTDKDTSGSHHMRIIGISKIRKLFLR
ncbi:MAG: hypothetical protein J5931_07495, partial [Prevotella sp.]|nr:hypothetical protein [Prevotella sp.]